MTHLRRIIARDVFISANAKACPMQFLKIELLNMVCLTEKEDYKVFMAVSHLIPCYRNRAILLETETFLNSFRFTVCRQGRDFLKNQRLNTELPPSRIGLG